MRRILRLLVLLLWLPCLGLAACGAGAAAPTAGSSSGSSAGSSGCADAAAPGPKDAAVSEPSGSLAKDKTYVVSFETSCGRIDVELDQADHPITANSFAHLVRERYYDQTTFHRVVPGFVIQGGDPAGTGTGGPSWKVTEKPAADTRYVKGVVAMAKTSAEPAGTSGSQFFIVIGDDVALPPDYAVAGRVTEGLAVADSIAAQGQVGADGPPAKPVVITSATLIER